MMGLTQRQLQCLTFIHEYQQDQGGISPSYQEIMEHLGLNSKSGVHRIVYELKRRRFLRSIPDHARSIEVVKVPTMDKPELLKAFLGEDLYERANLVRGRQSLKSFVAEAVECFVQYEEEDAA